MRKLMLLALVIAVLALVLFHVRANSSVDQPSWSTVESELWRLCEHHSFDFQHTGDTVGFGCLSETSDNTDEEAWYIMGTGIRVKQ